MWKKKVSSDLVEKIFNEMKVFVKLSIPKDKEKCQICGEIGEGINILIQEDYNKVKRTSKFFVCGNCIKQGTLNTLKEDVMYI